ncbi:PQQ-binding-like beta-propeller repeat protein [Nannocystis sp. RBIL2]|uniref:outer membrane protein assembly factor BamB family protein n=1 Tax=Nannocystis sp. RBIL2 TaxID=2996788 RepID=UPI00226E1414|nr:PQQ-binding-like beta-propeller repeat protein [Nannocystis sp. RBIL2]MCY1069305.1 PQQ-binding-like beta-propeller repeat protein [Nannocystis sp. RBIL2]
MRLVLQFSSLCAVLAIAPSVLAAPPAIQSLSSATVTHNGRVRIFGTDFGKAPGLVEGASVEIGGVPVATARWEDGAISAYVTRDVPLGDTTLRVVTSEGASAAVPLTIEPLPPADGRVAWRFQVDGMGIQHRSGIGPDGTVIAVDALGFVYALGHDGLLKWIHDGPRRAGHEFGSGSEGPVAVGADGSSYVGIEPLGPDLQLHALAPDGTLKWILNEPWANTVSGPAIGPEGDVYWAVTAPGGGLQRLKPSGELVWSNVGEPPLSGAYYERSHELLFGPSRANGPIDQAYFAATLGDIYNGMPTPPFLYGFSLDGQQRFATYVKSMSGSFSPRGQAAVAPDGRVYLSSWGIPEGWGLHAYEPGGGERVWSYFPEPGNVVSMPEFDADGNLYVMHDGSYLTSLDAEGSLRWEIFMETGSKLGPSLSPDGSTILIDGMDIAPDGELDAYDSATGAPMWKVLFPIENGTYQMPSARARFTVDGTRAYVSTAIGGQPDEDVYGWLYAIEVEEATEPGETDGEGSTTGEPDPGTDTDATGEPGTSTGEPSTSSGEAPTTAPNETATGAETGADEGGDGGSSAGETGAQDDPGAEGCGCRSANPGGAGGLLLALPWLVRARRSRRGR